MRIPKDLVPQKAVAEDLCVSLVTLWRARRSGLTGSDVPGCAVIAFRDRMLTCASTPDWMQLELPKIKWGERVRC